ncbi:MAG: helix-turn-helix transcriptional regulator [Ferruginibacter sp.]|nr:helix-turn-helix transcriptional regulator [Cytophagales bacterium]
MYSSELLKGSLQTIILKLLSENGRMYGYEITGRVKALSEGEILLTEGALYPTLHKLEADGLVVTETVSLGKRIRKYYSLTPAGTATATARVQEFLEFVQTMRIILATKPSPDA